MHGQWKFLSALAAIVCAGCGGLPREPAPWLPSDTRQLLTVVSPGWEATTAELTRYERRDQTWIQVGSRIPVQVGRSGMGWGRGIAADVRAGDPLKKEGDGRAPAGAFRLSAAFGYAFPDQAAAAGAGLPYMQATPELECVDDAGSVHYNRLVRRSGVPIPDWNSSEQMLRQDGQYRWGVVVAHNSDPPVPGAGSCIFLHIWEGPSAATSGCTAMAEADMRQLFAWLDDAAQPLLVQLPDLEYQRLREAWRLP